MITIPRFVMHKIVNSMAATIVVRCVFMDIVPLYFIYWNLIEQHQGFVGQFNIANQY